MQLRWMSFLEAVANIVVGYGLALLTQIMVFPLFGLHASLGENLLLGSAFTVVSLVRSFALRGIFNRFDGRYEPPGPRRTGNSHPQSSCESGGPA
jgi:hypothetical protein